MDSLFKKPKMDESIVDVKLYKYSPFLNSFNKNDIIRIQIQNQNINILPCTSKLYIEGTIVKTADNSQTEKTKLVNNVIAFMISEIKYELNGKVLDINRNVGIVSCLKNYISLNKNESLALNNAGWSPEGSMEPKTLFFNFCIPLRRLLGFFEDYTNIIPHAKHELILTRAKTDNNALFCTDNEIATINLTKVQWMVQHVTLADESKLELYKNIENNMKIMMPFRSWEIHEYPSLPQNTNHHIWSVKTTTQIEKPRFVVFALQTDREDQIGKDPSRFDHCHLTDLKVYLNSECYPYEDMNLEFDRNRYGIAYDAYTNFRNSYYNYTSTEPLLSWEEFKSKAAIFVIDTRYQDDSLKSSSVDVRIEMKTSKNIPANTKAYCLLLHDKLVEYAPLTGEVNIIN